MLAGWQIYIDIASYMDQLATHEHKAFFHSVQLSKCYNNTIELTISGNMEEDLILLNP